MGAGLGQVSCKAGQLVRQAEARRAVAYMPRLEYPLVVTRTANRMTICGVDTDCFLVVHTDDQVSRTQHYMRPFFRALKGTSRHRILRYPINTKLRYSWTAALHLSVDDAEP